MEDERTAAGLTEGDHVSNAQAAPGQGRDRDHVEISDIGLHAETAGLEAHRDTPRQHRIEDLLELRPRKPHALALGSGQRPELGIRIVGMLHSPNGPPCHGLPQATPRSRAAGAVEALATTVPHQAPGKNPRLCGVAALLGRGDGRIRPLVAWIWAPDRTRNKEGHMDCTQERWESCARRMAAGAGLGPCGLVTQAPSRY